MAFFDFLYRWVEDKRIEAVKFYRTTDEPEHEALTDDEIK